MIGILFLCLSALAGLAAETVMAGSGENCVRVISSTAEETILEYCVGSFEKNPVRIGNEDWYQISLPKEGITLLEGYPELPVLNRSLIIPDQARMKLEILGSSYQDFPLPVAPSKGNLLRSVDPASVPYGFGDVYQRDAFYPAELATLSEPYILSDLRGITVRTIPFAYNPVTRTLRVYTSYRIRVYADGTDSVNTLTRQRSEISRAFVQVYENQFLNWPSWRYTPVDDSFGKLLVICHSSLVSALEPWLNWKRQKGIETELVEFSTIGTTAAQLQTYIQTRYNAYNQIKYVQLVGDAAQIPSLIWFDGAADPIYGLVAGADSYPDIFIGRFSATSAAELSPQLDKAINYEKDLGVGQTWLAKATGIASNEGPGDNGEMDYEHMDVIRDKLLLYGYTTVDQFYQPTATAAQVSAALNDGRGFLNYCGHGSEYGWSTTGFSNTHVNALTNGIKTPVIMDVACFNGNFVDYTCFAEAWLRKSSGGAVSIYASSIGQAWSPPMRAQDEVTDLLVADAKLTVGGLFYNGSCKMIDVYGNDGVSMYYTWHIFGDATLLMRSKTPQAMAVSHPGNFEVDIPFSVNTGVAGALVGMYRNGVLYASAYAGAGGTATVTVPSSATGIDYLTITVTAHNRVTYTGSMLNNFEGNIWTGNFSSNWNSAANWSTGMVPTSLQDVLIPSGTPHSPSTSSGDGVCRDLYLGTGGGLTVATNDLFVYNDMHVWGLVTINTSGGDLAVARDVFWNAGAQVSTPVSGADLYCGRNMVFNQGSNVNFNQGNVWFDGTVNSSLTNHSAATELYNLRATVSAGRHFSFASASTQDILIKGGFYNYTSSLSYNYYLGIVTLRGDLVSYNSSSPGLMWNFGHLILDGGNQQIVLPHASDYLNQLTLSHSGTCTLNGNLTLKGGLTFESGVLDCNSFDIELGGSWVNPLGEAAFLEGGGRVTFNGSTGHQYCNNTETFNILEVDKSTGAFRVNGASAVVTCAQYDWTAGAVDVLAGTFTANDLADNGIYGNWYVNPGGVINLKNYGGWVDLNGSLTFTGGGEINVFGGSTISYWPYAGNASITMSGGILDFKDQGIQINNSATYSFSSSISGGTIRSSRSFTVNRADFNPSGGDLEFYGSLDATLTLAAGSNLHGLTVNKGSTRGEELAAPAFEADRFGRRAPLTRSNTVTPAQNLVLNGSLHIQAGILAAPALLTVKGNWTNEAGPSGFVEGTGLVVFAGSGNSSCGGETFHNLELAKTGSGRLVIPGGSVSCASYDWSSGSLEVAGGTFTANDLYDNNLKGAYILSAGTINLTQDSSFFVDLDADLNISGGTMNVWGGMPNVPSEWAYTRAITVSMSGGTLDFKNNGITFANNGYNLIANLSGGVIRTTGSVAIERVNFYLPGGSIELYGGADATLSQTTASSFYNLNVNKSPTREGGRERSNRVSPGSNLVLEGGLTLNAGTFAPGAYSVTLSGDLMVRSVLEMTNPAATLVVNGNVSWSSSSSSNITAGTIQASQNWTIINGSAMQLGGGSTVTFIGTQTSTIYAYSPTAWFNHLASAKTASLINVSGGGAMLAIHGDLNIPAGKTITFTDGTATIGGTWTQGGVCTVGLDAPVSVHTLQLNGSLVLNDGGVTVSQGFNQGGTGTLTLAGGDFVLAAPYTGALYGFGGTVNLNSGTLQVSNNGVLLGSSSNFNQSGGSFRIGWSFRALEAGAFQPDQGSVEFFGSRSCTIECSADNYFHDLRINKSGASYEVLLLTDVLVGNDLLVQGGSFMPNHRLLTVNRDLNISGGRLNMGYADDRLRLGRDWLNTAGTAGFIEGQGTVTFFGALPVSLPSETFRHLEVDKPVSQTNVLLIGSGVTVNVTGNLALSSGCLKLAGTGILDLNGDLTLQSGGGLWLGTMGEDTLLRLGGSLADHNGTLGVETSFNAVGDCTLILDGSGDQTLWVNYPTLQVCDLTVQKAGGSVLPSNHLTVTGDFHFVSGTWGYAAGGLLKSFGQDVLIEAGAVFDDPTGEVRIQGSQSTQLSILSPAVTGTFRIQKAGNTSTTVSLGGNCLLGGSTALHVTYGVLDLAGHTLQTSGTISIAEDGKLLLSPDSRLELGDGSALNVNSGGEFYALGAAGHHATLTSPDGYYAFSPGNYSTVGAQYCVFEKMNANGINLGLRTGVDPAYSFHYCTFQNGTPGGTLLRKSNVLELTVNGAVFPENTWGGAYNVYHGNQMGALSFENATGAFAGEAYENDPYNHVFWNYSGTLDPPQNLVILNSGGLAQLTWDASPGAASYNIYRSSDPYAADWGAPVGTASSTAWTDTAPPADGRAFYRVTAEN
jgi:hypothetical protein